jgi:hypothetical protein
VFIKGDFKELEMAQHYFVPFALTVAKEFLLGKRPLSNGVHGFIAVVLTERNPLRCR